MARGLQGGTGFVRKVSANPSLPKSPSVDNTPQVYNPAHKGNIGVKRPRIKPMKTRIYAKDLSATDEDPTKYENIGYSKV